MVSQLCPSSLCKQDKALRCHLFVMIRMLLKTALLKITYIFFNSHKCFLWKVFVHFPLTYLVSLLLLLIVCL